MRAVPRANVLGLVLGRRLGEVDALARLPLVVCARDEQPAGSEPKVEAIEDGLRVALRVARKGAESEPGVGWRGRQMGLPVEVVAIDDSGGGQPGALDLLGQAAHKNGSISYLRLMVARIMGRTSGCCATGFIS